MSEFVEAWWTNHRINEWLLDAIDDDAFGLTLSPRGGGTVAGQFAHLHNVRVSQLEGRARELSKGLEKIPVRSEPTRAKLKKSLAASAKAVAQFLEDIENEVPKRRGFKKGLPTTLSYFVAHESHHRGNILLTLKISKKALPKDDRYAIWDWDRR